MTVNVFLTEPPPGKEDEYVHVTTYLGPWRISAIILRTISLVIYLGLLGVAGKTFQIVWETPHAPASAAYMFTLAYLAILGAVLLASSVEVLYSLATRSRARKDFYVPRAAEHLALNALMKLSR